MKVGILGGGLTSLTLAKKLTNLGISVDIIFNKKVIKNKTRTIGISKSNINFFNREILDISKFLWKINKIEILTENLKKNKVIEFENYNKCLFSLFKNDKVLNYLSLDLKRNKLIRFKKKLIIKNYDLIINCQKNNSLSKKFFFKKIIKDYKSFAYTTIIRHNKLLKNNVALQVFTKRGPLAFLPLSSRETSIVFSARGSEKVNLSELIKKYGEKYSNVKMTKIEKFEIKSNNLRVYYYKNILAFGDMLHQIHPLAGQGFNMILRDIKVLIEIIKLRIENGLDLNSSIFFDFEKKIKHKNYFFIRGIDLIYEFFNFESKFKNKFLSNSLKIIGKNKFFNKTLKQYADQGVLL